LRKAAAELRPVEFEIVPQDIKKRGVAFDGDVARRAVYA